MSGFKKQLGNSGEDAACQFLLTQGYQILYRNFRRKIGEIDIICEYRGLIIFVEVKTRRSCSYGFPSEAVTYKKRQKIINTAMVYLNEHRSQCMGIRFDIIEIFVNGTSITCNHIINAFGR
jgi:putative endonuclease